MKRLAVALALVLLAFAAWYVYAVVSSPDFISRNAPSREDLLKKIDDEQARNMFAGLTLEAATDEGGIDSLITSRWCGSTAEKSRTLFQTGFVKTATVSDFIIPIPAEKHYAMFGRRGIGYREYGIGLEENSGCIDLYIIDI